MFVLAGHRSPELADGFAWMVTLVRKPYRAGRTPDRVPAETDYSRSLPLGGRRSVFQENSSSCWLQSFSGCGFSVVPKFWTVTWIRTYGALLMKAHGLCSRPRRVLTRWPRTSEKVGDRDVCTGEIGLVVTRLLEGISCCPWFVE